jgi:hypothetical protein
MSLFLSNLVVFGQQRSEKQKSDLKVEAGLPMHVERHVTAVE